MLQKNRQASDEACRFLSNDSNFDKKLPRVQSFELHCFNKYNTYFMF